MKNFLETIKNKQIFTSGLAMFALQAFTALSIIFILATNDDVYVVGTQNRMEGYIYIGVSTLLSFVISTGIFFVAISRLRSVFGMAVIVLPVILAIVILLAFPQVAAILPAGSTVSVILILTFWMGYLMFGLANWLYYKLRNVYLALGVLSFFHFGSVIIYISDKISADPITLENIANKVGSVWDIPTLIMIGGFLFLAVLLLIADSKVVLSRWQKNLRKDSRLGYENLTVFGALFTMAIIVTLFIAPIFWRLHWQQVEYDKEIQKKIQEELDEQLEEDLRKIPPFDPDRPYESPQNDGDKFDSGGRIEEQVPLGSGKPIFAVRLGEEESILTENNMKIIFASNNEEEPKFVWRADVYDKYSSLSGFTKNTQYKSGEYILNKQQGYYYSGVEKKYENTNILEQRYVILDITTQQVFSVNRPIEINYEINQNVPYLFGYSNDTITTDARQFLEPGSRYFSRSEILGSSELLLRSTTAKVGFTDNEVAPNYVFDFSGEVFALANSITKNLRNDFDKAKAIEKYLRENYEYKVEEKQFASKVLNQLSIEDFLFETKQGELTHFVGAMVLLLDQLGIDARIANGFYQGTFDPSLDGFIVTDNDFGYWVEIFFNNYGWLEFHPAGSQEQIKQDRIQQGYTYQNPDSEQKEDIQDGLEGGQEYKDDIEDKREEWKDTFGDQFGEEPPIGEPTPTPDPNIPTITPTPVVPTPTPTPPDFSAVQNFFNMIWEFMKAFWWLICCSIILLLIIVPLILKQTKYAWRKGVFSKRSDKDQIKQYFLYLQDVLRDFGDEIKTPETAYQFIERFVEEFPIENKDEQLKDELYTLATVYNRAVFSNEMREYDLELMNDLTDKIITKYLKTKGIKQLLRWYNPAGLFN